MKKCLFFILCHIFAATTFLTAQEKWNTELLSQTPEQIAGVWERSDRIIYFPQNTSQSLSVILKTLYGWYYDRSTESSQTTSQYPLTINSVTKPVPEQLTSDYRPLPILFEPILQTQDSGVWEMIIHYGKNQEVFIPIAVIGDKLYLDFAIRDIHNDLSSSSIQGLWYHMRNTRDISIDTPIQSDTAISYYVTDTTIYGIRYWKTDMEYDSSQVTLVDRETTLTLDKHVPSGNTLFTCVMGRRKMVRNADVTKYQAIPEQYALDSSGLIMAFGNPYLVKSKEMHTYENVLALVQKMNARRISPPKPLFPPSNVNWHYDLIYRLESGNPIIAAVRQRQKEFAQELRRRQQS